MGFIQIPYFMGMSTYTPVLLGATNNPAATYTIQQGRYCVYGKLVYVEAQITTSTMSKTTLTDQVRVSLPIASSTASNNISHLSARVENSTVVMNATQAEVLANSSYAVFRSVPVASASSILTYALASLGVLTNTVTVNISGWYEAA